MNSDDEIRAGEDENDTLMTGLPDANTSHPETEVTEKEETERQVTAKEETPRDQLKREIENKQRRKLKSRREGRQSPWFGLGMFGLVGWSVALPTLLGIACGSWIDYHWPGQISWTLTLLFAGVVIGFANAWYWMQKESNDSAET